MKIAVIGTGYVGLVTGTCLAESGNKVSCVDIDQKKVEALSRGELTIFEPELDELLHRNIKEKRITFTTSLATGIEGAEIIFLALPTPPGKNGSADLSYIFKVASQLSILLKKYTLIVNKSTVPVGTAEKVADKLSTKTKVKFDVVSNPEFLREGFAVSDFMSPDRIVVGTSSKRAAWLMKRLYQPFISAGSPFYLMDERSAEMTKYAANSFLAMKISYINEIANLSELTGANVDWVRAGIGADERIGSRFLFPGIGYGGSCFPKDVLALYHTAQENKYDFEILKAVMKINKKQKKIMINKVKEHYKNNLKGKVFAVWGLAFKPDTDDMREAPSVEIITELVRNGANIKAFDPEAANNARRLFADQPAVKICEHQYDTLEGADAILIVTEWSVFRTPDFKMMEKLLKSKTIFDGRNIYDPLEMAEHGFFYSSVGRGVVGQ